MDIDDCCNLLGLIGEDVDFGNTGKRQKGASHDVAISSRMPKKGGSQRGRVNLRPSNGSRISNSTEPSVPSSGACCSSGVHNDNDSDIDMSEEYAPMAEPELQDLTGASTEDIPGYPTEWQQRRGALEENWKTVRPSYAHTTIAAQATPHMDTVCTQCKILGAVVRCLTCLDSEGDYSHLCGICDEQQHPHAHFHVRQVWKEGYYKEIPAQQCFDDSGQPAIKGNVLSLGVCRV